MSFVSVLSKVLMLLTMLASVIGCSESAKDPDPLPEIIQPVHFPFIENDSFYSFDPESGKSKLLDTFDNNLILALDTDASAKELKDDEEIFNHTSTPESFVYVKGQTLHLFDLTTRIQHLLYDFSKDTAFDPDTNDFTIANPSFICDIQKQIIWDDEARLARYELFKEYTSIFVKTSNIEDCSLDTAEITYWEISITESEDTIRRRKKILLEHPHEHRHFHDHDDDNYEFADLHSHDHNLKEGEEDSNGERFDPNDHTHEHFHTHDFLYGNEHHHDHLNKTDVEAIHNNVKYQEIEFEDFPKLVGKKTTINSIDEAIMYSGRPILDINNRQYGYLGFNTEEKAYKFYAALFENSKLTVNQLWTIQDNSLVGPAPSPNLSNTKKLAPSLNKPSNIVNIENNLFLVSGLNLYHFTLAEFFDDDEDEARTDSIQHPVFTAENSNFSFNYYASYEYLIITDGLKIWKQSFEEDIPSSPVLIKTFSETNLVQINAYLNANEELVVEKKYDDSVETETSIVIIDGNGLEIETLYTKTNDGIETISSPNGVLINRQARDSGSRNASYYAYDEILPSPYQESIWVQLAEDYRNNQINTVSVLLSSDSVPLEPASVYSPSLYLFDSEEVGGRGKDSGFIQDNIVSAETVIYFNDYFGLIETKNVTDELATYFFSNTKNSFNFDNEFKVMKKLDTSNLVD